MESSSTGSLEKMGLVLDTSVLIASEKGHFDLEELIITQIGQELPGLPTIVAAEYLHGVERALPGRRRNHRLAFLDELFARSQILPFDLDTARLHASVWAQLAASGITVGAHDLIIAATCLYLDWDLATLNRAEFSRVPSLRLVPTDAGRLGD